jgi:hypothetical protein
MRQIIGFANQFYTLWSVTEEPQYICDSYGKYWLSRVDYKYRYLKNVSKSVDNVKRKYPQLQIDESLRGKCWDFIKNGDDVKPDHIFWKGKYYGRLISEVAESDWQYVLWVHSNIRKYKKYIEGLPQYQQYLKEQLVKEQEKQTAIDALKSQIPIGKPIVVNGISNGYNLNTCSETEKILSVSFMVEIDGMDNRILVVCNDARRVNGLYPYLMPVINGKAQRTKNKSFTIVPTDVRVFDDYSIVIWVDPITPTYGSQVIY